ncbi:melanopsin-B-like [Symsagittifera roscoffensis]|uniref:melanopsin-B-like n=1 Tax=Symsagittifera roscoffensis TaxID=84072 RepID=UPI00307B3AE3
MFRRRFSANGTVIGPWWEDSEFSPDESLIFYLFGVVLCAVICIGLTGNFMTIVIFARGQPKKSHNTLTLGLAYSDLMMVLGSQMPTCISAFRTKWTFFSTVGCTMSAAFGAFSGFSSILIMSFIAYNRYVSVYYPLDAMAYQDDHKRTGKMLAASYLTSAMLAALPMSYNGYRSTTLPFCCVLGFNDLNWRSVMTLVCMYSIGFIIPLLSICWFYIQILRKIRQTNLDLAGAKNHANQHSTEKKAVITSLLCVVVFVFCWLPYATVLLVGHLPFDLQVAEFKPHTIALAAVCAKMSAACNPFIYGSLHVKKK